MVGYFMKIFRSQGTLQNALHEVIDMVVFEGYSRDECRYLETIHKG